MKNKLISFVMVMIMISTGLCSTALAGEPERADEGLCMGGELIYSIDEGDNAGQKEEFTDEDIIELAEEGRLTPLTIRTMGLSVDDDSVPIDRFDFICTDDSLGDDHVDINDDVIHSGFTSIESGEVENVMPINIIHNGHTHTYNRAYVGKTRIYHIGTITISGTDYIYYVTDPEQDDMTAYSVLKDGEKIVVEYNHTTGYIIDYAFTDMDGNTLDEGPDGLDLGEIFGGNALRKVTENSNYTVDVSIPRGYRATVNIYNDLDNDGIYDDEPIGGDASAELGEMVSYVRNGDIIRLSDTSAASTVYKARVLSKNVCCNQLVVLSYEKIENYNFNADMWLNTVYARGRISFDSETPSVGSFTYDEHSYTWRFSTVSRMWEVDSLIINGSQVYVPMVKLNSGDSLSKDTVLPTGTKINLSVSADPSTGKRSYVLAITDCYEDITISSGNTIGSAHKELVVQKLRGVESEQYWAQSGSAKIWKQMDEGTLIGRKGGNANYSDPIRFKSAKGYGMAEVSVLSKEGILLQCNSINEDGTENNYIEYLILKDSLAGEDGDTGNHIIISGNLYSDENFDVVSYSDWKESADGYYYFRGTKAMDDYMSISDQGAVLLSINAEPISVAIDYIIGTDRENAPAVSDVINMPVLDTDGGRGYNCEENSRIIFSATIPRDRTGNYVFDHWELLTVNKDENGILINLNDTVKELYGEKVTYNAGEDVYIQKKLINDFEDCYYYNDESMAVFTLRPAWKNAALDEPISYNVHYYVDGVEIFSRNHPVNNGALIVTDLYKSDGVTLSTSIQNVLTYNNKNAYDYTEGGKVRYIVDKRYTTMRIDSVSAFENKANIYLVPANTDISVEKKWIGERLETDIVIQLQRRTDSGDEWENVGNHVTLSGENGWRYLFADMPVYKDENDLASKYTYRIVELNENLDTVEDGERVIFNTYAYRVSYVKYDNNYIITNTYEGPTVGSVTVKKTVSGASGDTEKNWNFTIVLDDTTINGVYGGMEFVLGKAKFTLKDGESRTASGLPKNTTYTVTETEADKNGYITTKIGDSGIIPGGNSAEVIFNNHRDKKPSSSTGDDYKIYYNGNGNTDGIAPKDNNTYSYGAKADVMGENSLEKMGYDFVGWNTKADGTGTGYSYGDRINMYENITLYAVWENTGMEKTDKNVPELNTEDHYAYMAGYDNGDFMPDNYITRAEVAVMFSRLIKSEDMDGNILKRGFTDVEIEKWYYDGICLMESARIIIGYPDGSFRPDNMVTRAEFATIVSKFDNLKESGNTTFSDLEDGYWGNKYIEMAHNRGWISGYADGTVRPEEYITRAEVISSVNRILGRVADIDYIDNNKDKIKNYYDLSRNHWAYYDIIEASNSHSYIRDYKEIWTGLD